MDAKKYGKPIEEIPGAYFTRKSGLTIHVRTSVQQWNQEPIADGRNLRAPDDAHNLKDILIYDDMVLIECDEGVGILIHADANVTTRTQIRFYKQNGRRFLSKRLSQLNPGWVMKPVQMKSDIKYIDVLMDKIKNHSARVPPSGAQRTILWHGTSQRRADNILRSGFRPNTFFSRDIRESQHFAMDKARIDNSEPAILASTIDLSQYMGQYQGHRYFKDRIYCFVPSIPPDVIRCVVNTKRVVDWNQIVAPFLPKPKPQKANDIMILGRCGAVGVACWINEYLGLQGDRMVKASHAGVKAIGRWIDAHYSRGRLSPISEKEMLTQMNIHLPEFVH
jgi:hypothetical protein